MDVPSVLVGLHPEGLSKEIQCESNEVVALPGRSAEDLAVLQSLYSVLKFFQSGCQPNPEERDSLPVGSRVTTAVGSVGTALTVLFSWPIAGVFGQV